MSSAYLDGDTRDMCLTAIREGRSLDDLAGSLHLDTELLGRLLQLPAETTPVDAAAQPADYLWAVDRLQDVL